MLIRIFLIEAPSRLLAGAGSEPQCASSIGRLVYLPASTKPCFERIRGHIDELFASGRQFPEILERVARLGAQLLMQAALEVEITEFLGRYAPTYPAAMKCLLADPRRAGRLPTIPV